jgi:hypothetical protein
VIRFPSELVFAGLFMGALAFTPRRYRHLQLMAVAGWALVWFDGELTKHWTDSLGLAITCLAMLLLAMTTRRPGGQHEPRDRGDDSRS